MDEPDSKNRESFRIRIGKVFSRKDIGDFCLIGSQYFQAMSVGIWLALLQRPKISLWSIALGALFCFGLCLAFRWFSNRLRRRP